MRDPGENLPVGGGYCEQGGPIRKKARTVAMYNPFRELGWSELTVSSGVPASNVAIESPQ